MWTVSKTCAKLPAMKILDVPQSGSVAGVTASRNRYGQYHRTRAVPVNPNTAKQAVVRQRLSSNAAAWRSLTANQRSGWTSLGAQIVRADSLGQSYSLSGFQAFASVNGNNLAAGNAIVDDAPAVTSPTGLVSATITLTAAAMSIAYTATPLETGARLFVFASPQRSAGRVFEGDYRLIQVSAAAQASPLDVYTAYCARLGVPVVGSKIFFGLQIYLGGFLGSPFGVAQVVAGA